MVITIQIWFDSTRLGKDFSTCSFLCRNLKWILFFVQEWRWFLVQKIETNDYCEIIRSYCIVIYLVNKYFVCLCAGMKRKTQDPPIVKDLPVNLEEIHKGTTKKMRITHNVFNKVRPTQNFLDSKIRQLINVLFIMTTLSLLSLLLKCLDINLSDMLNSCASFFLLIASFMIFYIDFPLIAFKLPDGLIITCFLCACLKSEVYHVMAMDICFLLYQIALNFFFGHDSSPINPKNAKKHCLIYVSL